MVRKIGQRTGRNIVSLVFTTVADNIQAVTVWPPAGQSGSQSIQETSTARELSADGLTELAVYEYLNGKWAKLATLN